MTRRDLLKLLLASAMAEAIDFEKLLWTPKPIIVPSISEKVWFLPSDAQIKFLESELPTTLYSDGGSSHYFNFVQHLEIWNQSRD